MQLCESCGACRENEWRICPFCRASLTTLDPPAPDAGEHFDALAAAAETSDLAALPSPIEDEAEVEPDSDLITEQDLAHLTGDGGPAANAWDSPRPPAPAPIVETSDGIDAPVSKVVVFPLVAVALAAVAFVAYSILTTSQAVRPDAVALIDRTTTTLTSTTTPDDSIAQRGAVGVDLAEQAERLCAGDQFSIARAKVPSLAIYNDVLAATRDGRDGWIAPADHVTLRDAVPPLIGCLTTADGGEIDRCPTDGPVISRRSVMWTYRVLQAIDGTELGADEGTATDVRSCDELLTETGGEDSASWSPLPQERLDQVAAAYTTAPHPQVACATSSSEAGQANADEADADRIAADPVTNEPLTQGLSLHATFDGITDVDVPLPDGWMATNERPVEAVLCLEYIETTPDEASDTGGKGAAAPPVATEACGVTIRVNAQHRDGRVLGSWSHLSSTCPAPGETVSPPDEWWIEIVGPELGYAVEPEEPSEGE